MTDMFGQFVDEHYLPLCEVCGKPMQLIGLRDRATRAGIRLPNDEEQYVIQCCGYTLTIEDLQLAEIATRNLKQYHGIKD